ncbi:MAG: ABC transporter ATP-binding protein [Lachnospiraceae bacterium]
MKFILSYLKKYISVMVIGTVIKVAGSMGELMIPYVLEHMIDNVVPGKQVQEVLIWGGIMITLTILVRQLNITANRMAVRVSKDSNYDIRRDLFRKSLNLSGRQVDEIGLPSLTSRMTSDSYNLQNFIRAVQTMGIRAPILLIGGIIVTLVMDKRLALILCIMAPFMIAIMVFISMKGIPFYEKVQARVDDIVRIMRENITGIRVVKALSKEKYEKERYGKANSDMAKQDMKAGIVMALPVPLVTMLLNVGLTLVVFLGAHLVNDGVTKPGVILAFLTYFNMVMMGTMGLSRVFTMMSKANASADRIQAVIDMEEELTPIPEEEAARTDREGYIVFDHVTFHYGNDDPMAGHDRQNCLTDIDFTMQKGGSLGIIGATGSGKTTIANLLMRFYDANEGHVFVDGKDVRTYEKDALHRLFGVVFQNDVIFADTLRENMAFGRTVDENRLWAAAEDARAKDFLEQYEEGLDHEAVIHGANLSGGQKQRVLIARALAAKPEILILDDSSSALDYKTDADLRRAIRENYGDTTTIIVAQRISSIMGLDDIIVLEEGQIIGHGTHGQLMENCKLYQDIYNTQMGGSNGKI